MMLSAKSVRRFGVEIELNRFRLPVLPGDDNPEGIHHVGQLVVDAVGEGVQIKKYGQTHNNDAWVLKPDSSCGMELVTPVMRGWHGLYRLVKVVEAISNKPEIEVDERCSLHLHAEVKDLTVQEVALVLGWWVKCEAVFLDAMPPSRKRNKYCQLFSLLPEFAFDRTMSPEEMIRFFGGYKYGSVNVLNLHKGFRPTLEVRIGDEGLCIDPYAVKNWVRLILHFIDVASKKQLDYTYKAGDVMSSWHWLDPRDVFALLGFDDSCELSPGLTQVKEWFLGRLCRYTAMGGLSRNGAFKQLRQMLEETNITQDALSPPNRHEALYGKIYQV